MFIGKALEYRKVKKAEGGTEGKHPESAAGRRGLSSHEKQGCGLKDTKSIRQGVRGGSGC